MANLLLSCITVVLLMSLTMVSMTAGQNSTTSPTEAPSTSPSVAPSSAPTKFGDRFNAVPLVDLWETLYQMNFTQSLAYAPTVENCSNPDVDDKLCVITDGCYEGHYCPWGQMPVDILFENDWWDDVDCTLSGSEEHDCCYYNESSTLVECKCSPGFYCPNSTAQPQYCFEGFYCPTPAEIYKCPKDHFCPMATVKAKKCAALDICPEGSVTPDRSFVIVAIGLVPLVLLVWWMLEQHLQGHMHNRPNSHTYVQTERNKLESQKQAALDYYSEKHGHTGDDHSKHPAVSRLQYALDVHDKHHNSSVRRRSVDIRHVEETNMGTVQSAPMTSPTPSHSLLESPRRGSTRVKAKSVDDIDRVELIEFEGLGLTLTSGTTVMEGVCGTFESNRSCAIMGPSGAGKTTVINLISGKVHKTHGVVKVNGIQVDTLAPWKGQIGFVPQDDVMHHELTVRQNIAFAANFRLERDWTRDEREAHVDWILDRLGLWDVQHLKIGTEEKRGISGGQRKRVNIGMELAGFPTVLFLDEPTSGLDSSVATDLTALLKRLVSEFNLMVVAVIHSPTKSAFENFDDLLLLQKGGRTAYFGPRQSAMQCFENMGFTKSPKQALAEFVLDVVSDTVHREVSSIEKGQTDLHEDISFADVYDAEMDASPKLETLRSMQANFRNFNLNKGEEEADRAAFMQIITSYFFRPAELACDDGLASLSAITSFDLESLEPNVVMAHRRHHRKLDAVNKQSRGNHAIDHKNKSHLESFLHWLATIVKDICEWMHGVFLTLTHRFREDHPHKRKQSTFFFQFWLCFQRAFRQAFPGPGKLLKQLLLHAGLGIAMAVPMSSLVFIGPYPRIMCFYVGSIAVVQQCMLPLVSTFASGGVTMGLAITFAAVATAINTFGRERVIYFREASAGLNTIPYFMGKFAVDFLSIVLASTFFWLGLSSNFSSLGSEASLFLIVLGFYCFGWGLGYVLSIVSDVSNANVLGVAASVLFCVLLGGSTPTLHEVDAEFSEWKWLWALSAPRYLIEAFFINELAFYETNPLNHSEIYINTTSTYELWDYDRHTLDHNIDVAFGISFGWIAFACLLMILLDHKQKK
eukprot:m.226409 g.226409  ORF g.226409 m.226409 type:complete len:1088 (-) comp33490_c0_seq1:114-3377(-)